jgi:hypothetical protein
MGVPLFWMMTLDAWVLLVWPFLVVVPDHRSWPGPAPKAPEKLGPRTGIS